MWYIYKPIVADIYISIDKHIFHNNIVSNNTWNIWNFKLKNTLYGWKWYIWNWYYFSFFVSSLIIWNNIQLNVYFLFFPDEYIYSDIFEADDVWWTMYIRTNWSFTESISNMNYDYFFCHMNWFEKEFEYIF